MLPRSIRWRFQLWLAFLLICLVSGFGITAYQLYRNNRLSQIDEDLEERVAAVAGDVRKPPPWPPRFRNDPPGGDETRMRPPFEPPPGFPLRDGPGGGFPRTGAPPDDWLASRIIELSEPTRALFDGGSSSPFYYAVWSRGQTLITQSANAPARLSPPPRKASDFGIHSRTRQSHREAYLMTELGEFVLAGRAIQDDLTAMNRFAWWLALAGLAVLGLGLGGGWVLVSRAFRPVEAISAAARRISSGNLDERIEAPESATELGRLAEVLNDAFARLDAAFAQQRRFTADASHELRTPIAVLLSETQTALSKERSAGEYRETIEACQDTAQEMRRLTESLLELARFDAGQEAARQDSVDLAALAQLCVEAIRPLAAGRRIAIRLDLHPAGIRGDMDRLRQVVTNLLTNAIHYNQDGGWISIATAFAGPCAILKVSDAGVGIPPEDLPHVFDRFYRGDRARGRGRTGLGLAICKAIVDAHGGSLQVSSEPGAGTTFTVLLPASPPESQPSGTCQNARED